MRAPDAVVAKPEECRAALTQCQHTPTRCRRQHRCEPHQIAHHRVVADRCRAQASSMPEGPATGRVEAKRRALTMPSTAPASSARWCAVRSKSRSWSCFSGERRPCANRFLRNTTARFWPRERARGRRGSPARTGLADSDMRHDQRWRERPRQGALGSGAGHDSGVVHAIVGAVTSTRALLDEAANSAASWSRARQRTLLQAVACGSCS